MGHHPGLEPFQTGLAIIRCCNEIRGAALPETTFAHAPSSRKQTPAELVIIIISIIISICRVIGIRYRSFHSPAHV